MSRKWSSLAGLILAATLLLLLSNCARDRQLIGITIQPTNLTFGSPDPLLTAQFTALGTYIHPQETKDITSQVTWKTDITQMISVSAGTVSPTGNSCGVANISASYDKGTGPSGNLVIGYATVTVDDPNVAGCPGAGGGGGQSPLLIVSIQGGGNGTVTSSPAGIACPATSCGATFAAGTTVTLIETPAGGSSFGGWGNCPSPSGNSCAVLLNNDTTVTATFN
jgi:hypothetical protein